MPNSTQGEKPLDARIRRFLDSFQAPTDSVYVDIYAKTGRLVTAFASLHERLDYEFDFMNHKAPNGSEGYYNAQNGRDLLEIINQIKQLRENLAATGQQLHISTEYSRVLENAPSWVGQSGSTIPSGLTPINIDRFGPIFSTDQIPVPLLVAAHADLKLVGEGAFALVHKFKDSNYGITFARKLLKSSATERESQRFRQEFDMMHKLDFPYILKVYRFNGDEQSYLMEYCHSTLLDFINKRNNDSNRLSMGTRQRIALQFLYGLNFLHQNTIFHRDLSLKNVLIHEYQSGAVMVKLSDFGLAKSPDSDFTKTDTDIRGTIIDPALDSFKSYAATNDIYAVGFILSFIFTGRRSLITDTGNPYNKIVLRCSNLDITKRYPSVRDIIGDVEQVNHRSKIGSAVS